MGRQQGGPFPMKTHSSLAAHNMYELALSHCPVTVHIPLAQLPAPYPTQARNLLVQLSPRETSHWTVNPLINTLIN